MRAIIESANGNVGRLLKQCRSRLSGATPSVAPNARSQSAYRDLDDDVSSAPDDAPTRPVLRRHEPSWLSGATFQRTLLVVTAVAVLLGAGVVLRSPGFSPLTTSISL